MPPTVDRTRLADPRTMSFGAHLEELRRRLIYALLSILPIFLVTIVFGDDLLRFLIHPAQAQLRAAGLPSSFQATGPLETLGAWLKVSAVLTIAAGVPAILLQLWLFVAPGLYPHEQRFGRMLAPMSLVLSAVGLVFLYTVMLPAMLAFLIQFGAALGHPDPGKAELPPGLVLPTVPVLSGDPPSPPPGSMWFNSVLQELRIAVPDMGGHRGGVRGVPMTTSSAIAQQYRVSEYVNLVFTMALAFAVGFQTPVVMLLLGWTGIVNKSFLASRRRYAALICVVVAAVLTPSPDPFSMMLLAVPLYGLFELGLVLMKFLPAGRVAAGLSGRGSGADGPREGPDAGED
ncbi:MAG: twin-arginine translocase subunit TatC [Phycisphaerales bacterium]